MFLTECCGATGKFFNGELILEPGARFAAMELFSRYETWCSGKGDAPLKIQAFKAQLQEKYDVTHTRIKGYSWWAWRQVPGLSVPVLWQRTKSSPLAGHG
jgi:hypothetical protein